MLSSHPLLAVGLSILNGINSHRSLVDRFKLIFLSKFACINMVFMIIIIIIEHTGVELQPLLDVSKRFKQGICQSNYDYSHIFLGFIARYSLVADEWGHTGAAYLNGAKVVPILYVRTIELGRLYGLPNSTVGS